MGLGACCGPHCDEQHMVGSCHLMHNALRHGVRVPSPLLSAAFPTAVLSARVAADRFPSSSLANGALPGLGCVGPPAPCRAGVAEAGW